MHPLLDTKKGLIRVLKRVNERRTAAPGGTIPRGSGTEEEILELLFQASQKLVIYGSLAPGESNHWMLRDVEGSWVDGFVRGTLHDRGWGAKKGFPGMTWDARRKGFPVKLLISGDLPGHWGRLDVFEGKDYVRILVPVEDESEVIAVANIYAIRKVT